VVAPQEVVVVVLAVLGVMAEVRARHKKAAGTRTLT
jgi:hypothetical protein